MALLLDSESDLLVPEKFFSGVILNQNQGVTATAALSSSVYYTQTFKLPADYIIGEGAERRVPSLTGFQVLATVEPGAALTATLNWEVAYYLFGTGWVPMQSGTTEGVHAEGDQVWVDVYFDYPVTVNEETAAAQWRIGLGGATGITALWYASPNPLTAQDSRFYLVGTTTDTPVDTDTSLAFRVLANVADSGTDFMGNSYRSVVVKNGSANISALDSEVKDKFWLSKPNPSRFAVESLYFDLTSRSGGEQVIDRILLDPLTLGSYFNVYYTSEGSPGRDDTEWNEKLWKRVPRTFSMTRRESHVLPEPISTKYIKLEFSHLQARYYSAGAFQESIYYYKHPRWVLDYFLVRTEVERQNLREASANDVGIVYSALDLAYNYYVDDLLDRPDGPANLDPAVLPQDENLVDSELLSRIDLAFRPYRRHPALFGKADYLLSNQSIARDSNYPIEQADPTFAYDQSILGQKRDDAVIFESTQPIMYFYLNCRHRYKRVAAKFKEDRAYFVGIKEVNFSRENYTVASDTEMYIESVSDNQNIVRNDFVQTAENIWTVE